MYIIVTLRQLIGDIKNLYKIDLPKHFAIPEITGFYLWIA